MVNYPKKNFSLLPEGIYGKRTNQSIQKSHQANQANSGLEEERFQALRALHTLRSKMNLGAEIKQQLNFLSHEDKECCIDDYVERVTPVAQKRVEHTETAIKQEQEAIRNAENAGLTCRQPEKSFKAMLNAVGDCLSDLTSSCDEDDGDVKEDDEDSKQGKLSEDDEPCWVMCKISKMV